MSSNLVKLSGSQIDDFFQDLARREIRIRIGHRWHTPARIKWLTYCKGCGLVFARNTATQKAINQGCFETRLKD